METEFKFKFLIHRATMLLKSINKKLKLTHLLIDLLLLLSFKCICIVLKLLTQRRKVCNKYLMNFAQKVQKCEEEKNNLLSKMFTLKGNYLYFRK